MKHFAFLIAFLPWTVFAQSIVYVNDLLYDTGCAEIKSVYVSADDTNSIATFIYKVEINDDCLDISVAYGGGCGTINFELINYTGIMESKPAKAGFFLKYKKNDSCKAFIHRTISFDLAPVYKSYSKAGGIKIWIRGTDYEFLYKN